MTGPDKTGLVIAVDGPSGVGKSTVSRLVADRLGYAYVDTGAMYRAFALAASDAGVDVEDAGELESFCTGARLEYDTGSGAVIINGADYSARVRTEEAGELASVTSAKAPVRRVLTELQRRIGAKGSVVMEGRDIGTVVFPDADVKFFLDAPSEVRIRRRHKELSGSDAASVRRQMSRRDERDKKRASAPLVKAPDALGVDTGPLDIAEVVELMLKYIEECCPVGDTRS